MGASDPKSSPSPSLFPSLRQKEADLAKVEADLSGMIRSPVAGLSIREASRWSLTVRRTMAIRDDLRSEVAVLQSQAQKEPEAKAEPKALTPSQWEAYDLLSDVAVETIENPCVCEALMEAAASGDKIGRHVGQGARWTGYLAAVTALRGGRYDDPAVEAAIRVVRSPTSIRAWLRAAGVEVVNG